MDKIEEVLTRGVENIIPRKAELEKVLRSGKKLRLYQGFDPSMPSLHLGNLVGVQKLRQFQELGHEVIFLIGDFTGMIGDPTDKNATRQMLSLEKTNENAKNWLSQIDKILKFDGPNPVRVLRNSDWNNKLTFEEVIKLASNFTVQQMLERDFFQERLKAGKPIHLHEFLYPLVQGYDSVAMDVDLEVGGNDQMFNLMAGRTLMAALKHKEKFCMTTKLLVDNAGNKVGKTTGNALFLDAPANDLFGSIMSFPDEVLELSFELLTAIPLDQIPKTGHPMELKKQLARQIVTELHSLPVAQKAQGEFEKTFQKKELETADIPSYPVTQLPSNPINPINLVCKMANLSKSEAKRLIEGKAVEINRSLISDNQPAITIKAGDIIKIGKRKFINIV